MNLLFSCLSYQNQKQNDARALRCFKQPTTNGIPVAKIIRYSSDGSEKNVRNENAKHTLKNVLLITLNKKEKRFIILHLT